MNKILEKINQNKAEQKKTLVGFITAGDPSLDITVQYMKDMEQAGVSVIEVGVPFSDPIGEGRIIQGANVRALQAEGGCTTDMVFDMLKKAVPELNIPVVAVTYLNPIFKYGYDAFCKRCREAGISGLVIPDLPFEEKEEINNIAQQYDLCVISTIPAVGKERAQMIAKDAAGYVHMIPSLHKEELETEMEQRVKDIQEVADIACILSVDVHGEKLVPKLAKYCDGVKVSNSIVNLIGTYGADVTNQLNGFVSEMLKQM